MWGRSELPLLFGQNYPCCSVKITVSVSGDRSHSTSIAHARFFVNPPPVRFARILVLVYGARQNCAEAGSSLPRWCVSMAAGRSQRGSARRRRVNRKPPMLRTVTQSADGRRAVRGAAAPGPPLYQPAPLRPRLRYPCTAIRAPQRPRSDAAEGASRPAANVCRTDGAARLSPLPFWCACDRSSARSGCRRFRRARRSRAAYPIPA